MKNLESVAGVTSAEVMGADLAEAEVGTKDLAGDDSEKVTLNGEVNGKDSKDPSTEHVTDSTKNIEITEKNSGGEEDEEVVNDEEEEDKVSFVSLSQSTDFEVSPSSEVFPAKEAEETEDISKHSDDITSKDLDDKSQGREEITTSQNSEDPKESSAPHNRLDEVKDDGADNNDEDEEERESKLGKKEEVKAVEGEEQDKECIEDAHKDGNKEQEDEEKSAEETSQMVEEKEDSIHSPSRIDEEPEDKIESEVKAEEDSMNLVLLSDSEVGEDSKEAEEEIKVEDKEKVEEAPTVESQDEHDDAYGSDDESMDSLDINQGLQECFKNLEEKIAQEAEEEDSRKRRVSSSAEAAVPDSAENSTSQTESPKKESADTKLNEEESEICLDKEVEKEKNKAEGSEESELRQQTAAEKMEEEM